MFIAKIKRVFGSPRRIVLGLLYRSARIWPDRLYLQLLYYFEKGVLLNLKQPKTFTEKLQWLKLNNRRIEYTKMVDKYAVKQYVADRIGEQYIIPTIGVWDRVEDIDWNSLPNQFVLKTTHGGGNCGVIICKDKATINKVEISNKIKKSLHSDIALMYREWPYKDVPKRIIAEKFMMESNNQKNGGELSDYKFYCFNGEPTYCQVIRNRNTKETIDFYDMEWNHMPFVGLNPLVKNGDTPVVKPQKLDIMIQICQKLSNKIPFARVDLYVIDEAVYFGEITFFPASGLGRFSPNEWDNILGDKIKLTGML